MFISDPDLVFLPSPDPGVKKAPDHGVKKAPDTGSATLKRCIGTWEAGWEGGEACELGEGGPGRGRELQANRNRGEEGSNDVMVRLGESGKGGRPVNALLPLLHCYLQEQQIRQQQKWYFLGHELAN